MFEEVRTHVPGLAAWVESCYGAEPLLHFGEHTILSRCEVQQGDPLGPLCFAPDSSSHCGADQERGATSAHQRLVPG